MVFIFPIRKYGQKGTKRDWGISGIRNIKVTASRGDLVRKPFGELGYWKRTQRKVILKPGHWTIRCYRILENSAI